MAFIASGLVPLHGLRRSRRNAKVNERVSGWRFERRGLVESSALRRRVIMTSGGSGSGSGGGGGGGGGGPPINAPSSVLLLTSSVLAIATIGCMFELGGGHPTYGQNLTTGILVLSLPGFLFFFYAAIRKGQQEAMDDP